MEPISISLRQDQYLELEKIGLGAFLPLDHFMNEAEFTTVTETMRLPDGSPFTIPVFLDVDKEFANRAANAACIELMYQGIKVGELFPESIFTCDKEKAARHVYGTTEEKHPGVKRFYDLGDWFIGGKTILLARVEQELSKYELTPADTKKIFAERGWKTIVGFQTRNVPRNAPAAGRAPPPPHRWPPCQRH